MKFICEKNVEYFIIMKIENVSSKPTMVYKKFVITDKPCTYLNNMEQNNKAMEIHTFLQFCMAILRQG